MAFKNEEHREAVRRIETAKIIKEALKIVDKLGELDSEDIDIETTEELIGKAQKLKKHKLWKLS